MAGKDLRPDAEPLAAAMAGEDEAFEAMIEERSSNGRVDEEVIE